MKTLATVLALMLIPLVACSDDDQSGWGNYNAICVDPVTHVRWPDAYCGADPNSAAASGWLWWYLAVSSTMPRIGYVPVGGYGTRPARSHFYAGVPYTGGRYTPPRLVRPPANAPRPPGYRPPPAPARPKPPPPRVKIR